MSATSTVGEASNVMPEFVRSIAHAPETVGHPWAIVAGSVVMAGYAAYEWYTYDPQKQVGLSHDPSNPGAVRQAVIDMESGEDKSSDIYDKFYRMGRPMLIGVGALALVTAFGANISYTSENVHGQANTVLDIQTSTSTLKTKDAANGDSRFDAAKKAIAQSGYSENMAVYQFGFDSNLTIPLQKFNEKVFNASVNPGQVNTNGANLVDSMDKAAKNLPNHSGTEIVITDGLVEDGSAAIDDQVAKQKALGIDTKIVVIGTNISSYQVNIGASPTPATPNTRIFNGLPAGVVERVSDPNRVGPVISHTVSAADSSPQKEPWFPAYIPGIALGIAGFLGIRRQHRKKLI